MVIVRPAWRLFITHNALSWQNMGRQIYKGWSSNCAKGEMTITGVQSSSYHLLFEQDLSDLIKANLSTMGSLKGRPKYLPQNKRAFTKTGYYGRIRKHLYIWWTKQILNTYWQWFGQNRFNKCPFVFVQKQIWYYYRRMLGWKFPEWFGELLTH